MKTNEISLLFHDIPESVILEYLIPFLDRQSYNVLSSADRYMRNMMMTKNSNHLPPWPNKIQCTKQNEQEQNIRRQLNTISISHDGKLLAATVKLSQDQTHDNNQSLLLWDIRHGPLQSLNYPCGGFNNISFAPDVMMMKKNGNNNDNDNYNDPYYWLASSTNKGPMIYIWNIISKKQNSIYYCNYQQEQQQTENPTQCHPWRILYAHVSPLSSTPSPSIPNYILSLSWHQKSFTLAAGFVHDQIQIWTPMNIDNNQTTLTSPSLSPLSISSLKYHARLAVGNASWDLSFYNDTTRTSSSSNASGYGNDSLFDNLLASACWNGEIQIWNWKERYRLLTILGHSQRVTGISFLDTSSLSSTVASSINSNKMDNTVNNLNCAIYLVSCSFDGTQKLWKIIAQTPTPTILSTGTRSNKNSQSLETISSYPNLTYQLKNTCVWERQCQFYSLNVLESNWVASVGSSSPNYIYLWNYKTSQSSLLCHDPNNTEPFSSIVVAIAITCNNTKSGRYNNKKQTILISASVNGSIHFHYDWGKNSLKGGEVE